MDKDKIIEEIDREETKIEANDNRYPGDAYWAGRLTEHLEAIRELVDSYNSERAKYYE